MNFYNHIFLHNFVKKIILLEKCKICFSYNVCLFSIKLQNNSADRQLHHCAIIALIRQTQIITSKYIGISKQGLTVKNKLCTRSYYA